MGQTSTSPNYQINDLYVSQSQIRQWTTAQQPQDAVFPNINIYRSRLLYNTITHEYIQQYNLNFASEQEFIEYIEILNWRISLYKQTKTYKKNKISDSTRDTVINRFPKQSIQLLPKIKFFRDTSSSQMCSTVHSGSIYFDRIQMRLKQIKDLPFSDILYMYEATLNGFQALYTKFGQFPIKQQMISITRQGKVYVWIHPNPSNHNKLPIIIDSTYKSNKKTIQKHHQQGQMILQLLKIIEDSIDLEEYHKKRIVLLSEFLCRNLNGNSGYKILKKSSLGYHQLPSMSIYYNQLQEHIKQDMNLLTFRKTTELLNIYYRQQSKTTKTQNRIGSVQTLFVQQKQIQEMYFHDQNDMVQKNDCKSENPGSNNSNNKQFYQLKQALESSPHHQSTIQYNNHNNHHNHHNHHKFNNSRYSQSNKQSEYRLGDQLHQKSYNKTKSPVSQSSNMTHNISKYGLKLKDNRNNQPHSRRVNTQYQITSQYQFKSPQNLTHNLNNEINKNNQFKKIQNNNKFGYHQGPIYSYRNTNNKQLIVNKRQRKSSDQMVKNLSIKSSNQSGPTNTHKYYTKPSTPLQNKTKYQKQKHNNQNLQVFFQPLTNCEKQSQIQKNINDKRQRHRKNNTEYLMGIQMKSPPPEFLECFNKNTQKIIQQKNQLKKQIKRYSGVTYQPHHTHTTNQKKININNHKPNININNNYHKPQNKSTTKINFLFSNTQNVKNSNVDPIQKYPQTTRRENQKYMKPQQYDIRHRKDIGLNIRYYTSNDSYQLDQQIADDLQKMLHQPYTK